MNKKSTSDIRAREVEKQLEEIWDSLSSHLYWCRHDSPEGKVFHKKCVKKYAKQMFAVTKLF